MGQLPKPVKICLYVCIPENQEFAPRRYTFAQRLKGTLRNSFNSFCTRLTGKLYFSPYTYATAKGLEDNSNRGDMAIRRAVRSQLRAAFASRPVHFLEIGWRDLTPDTIDHVNQHADLFVIAGGGYIFVNGDGSPGAMLAKSSDLGKLNCPIVAVGIGLNRLMHETPCALSELAPDARENIKQLSHLCRAISVRDQDTADLFALYGDKTATVIGDPVLYFSEVDAPSPARTGPLTIGVNLAVHGPGAYSYLAPILPHIVAGLKRVQQAYQADMTYLLHHDLERPIIAYLQQKGLRLKIVDGTATQLIDAYRQLDFVINQMLHSCIFAANAGVPFLNLAYDQKSVAFCSLLGIPECAVGLSEFTQDLLAQKVDGLLTNRFELATRILEKRAWLRSQGRSFLDNIAAQAG